MTRPKCFVLFVSSELTRQTIWTFRLNYWEADEDEWKVSSKIYRWIIKASIFIDSTRCGRANVVLGQRAELRANVLATGLIESQIPLWCWSAGICERSRRGAVAVESGDPSLVSWSRNLASHRGDFDVHLCNSRHCSAALAHDRIQPTDRLAPR